MRVSDEHPWNWPQNLICGVHFRIYYDRAKKPHPTGRIVSPPRGTALGTTELLQAEATSPNGAIRQLDFLGHYEDVNLEGDGIYTQWHYHYVRAALAGHIGTATSAPWQQAWDTSWVPDQPPFRLAARITDETGLTYFSEAVEDLRLCRHDLSVELCKPEDVPRRWLTRSSEHQQTFRVTGNLDKAAAARLEWVSWCPGYMEGLYLNGHLVLLLPVDPSGRLCLGKRQPSDSGWLLLVQALQACRSLPAQQGGLRTVQQRLQQVLDALSPGFDQSGQRSGA